MHTILITGAGSGIGKATAQLLSKRENTRLLLVGRRKDKLEEVLNCLENSSAHTIGAVDVSKKEELIEFLASDPAI